MSYKDTYQIRPLVTAGAARHNDLVTLTADGDLTETKGFKAKTPPSTLVSVPKSRR